MEETGTDTESNSTGLRTATENSAFSFCSLKIKSTFNLNQAISQSSSSPQLFQPAFPTNLAFETLQILGPHLIFSLKPRCFLVAAGCRYWIWRKTNALQAVWLSNCARRRPTYIRWASETAVPTKNLIEGTRVRKVQQHQVEEEKHRREQLNHFFVGINFTDSQHKHTGFQ